MKGSKSRNQQLANARASKKEIKKANNPLPTDDPPNVEMESYAESEQKKGYKLRARTFVGSYNPTPPPQPTPAQQQARSANIKTGIPGKKKTTMKEKLAKARNTRQNANSAKKAVKEMEEAEE